MVSAGTGDNSDLDTYRVFVQCLYTSLMISELLGAAFAMTAGKIPPSLYVGMSSAKHALTYTSITYIADFSGLSIHGNVDVRSVQNPLIERICSRFI